MKIQDAKTFNNFYDYSYKKNVTQEVPGELSAADTKISSEALSNVAKAGIAIQNGPAFKGMPKIVIPKERLVEVLALGLTYAEMCRLLGGISKSTLIKRLKENDLEYTPANNRSLTNRISKERFEEVYNMEGSDSEKAKELGVSLISYYKLARVYEHQGPKIKRNTHAEAGKITKEKFAAIHLNPNMNHKEKLKAFGISENTYYNFVHQFNLHSDFAKTLRKNKDISEAKFRAVAESDIPFEQKLRMLDMNSGTYYRYMAKFNILTDEQKKKQKAESITREEFQRVFEMDIPNAEKCKILQISHDRFNQKAKDFGLRSKHQINRENAKSITKARFIEVFNMPIKEKEKWAILGISHVTYRKYAFQFGLIKEGAKGILKDMSEEEFRRIFEMDVPLSKKLEMLKCKNANTYVALMARFGLQSERQLYKEHVSSFTKEQVEEILQSDLPEAEKLAKAGLTASSYKKLLHKFGLLTEWQRVYLSNQNISREQLLAVINKNKTVTSICKELKISYRIFYRLVNKYNLNYQPIIEKNQTKEGGRSSYKNFTTDKLQDRLVCLYMNDKIAEIKEFSTVIDFLSQQDEYPLSKKAAIVDFIRNLDAFEMNSTTKEDILNSESLKQLNDWIDECYEPYELKTRMELLQEVVTKSDMYHMQEICLKYLPQEDDMYNPERIEICKRILASTEKYIDADELSQKDIKDLANILTYYDTVLTNPDDKILKAAEAHSERIYGDISPLHVQQIINIIKEDGNLLNNSKLFLDFLKRPPLSQNTLIEYMIKLDNYFDTEESRNNLMSDFCNEFNSGTVLENKIIDEFVKQIYINIDTVKESQESNVHRHFVSILDKEGKQKVWNSKVNIDKTEFFRDTEKYMDTIAEGKTKRPGIKTFTLDNGDNIAEIKVSGFNGARMFAKLESLEDEIYVFNDFAPKGFHTNLK